MAKTLSAECENCGWKGSKHRIVWAPTLMACPTCNSINVIIYGKPRKLTRRELALQFAEYYRNGVTNIEACKNDALDHFNVFIKKIGING